MVTTESGWRGERTLVLAAVWKNMPVSGGCQHPLSSDPQQAEQVCTHPTFFFLILLCTLNAASGKPPPATRYSNVPVALDAKTRHTESVFVASHKTNL